MKRICGFLLGAMLMGISASAQIEQVGNGAQVRVSGTAEPFQVVAIDVLKSDVAREDLEAMEPTEYLDAIVCHDQVSADADGNYEFNFNINIGSGKYTVYSGTSDVEFDPETFVFVSNSDYTTVSGAINEASTAQIEDMIEKDPYVLGLDESDIKDISIKGLANVLAGTLEDEKFDASDREKSWAIVDRALFVQKLNEGKITDITKEDNKITGLEESEISDWLKKDFVNSVLTEEFTKRISDKNFESVKDYSENITEAFVLAVVKEPNGVSNVEDIIKAFSDEIGVSVKNLPNGFWSKLAGEAYSDFDDLKTAFNKYKNSDSSTNGGSNTGGKTNSRGGSVGVTDVALVPVTENNTKLNPEIFNDLGSVEWAKEAIVYLAEKQIINGVGDMKFAPDSFVTREQFAKIAVNAFVPDTDESTQAFSDVESGSWYESSVKKAVNAGVAKGMGDGTFGVGRQITRQDMCVMIYNAAKAAGKSFKENTEFKFSDDLYIADYAKEAVYALFADGAVSGMTASEFAPRENATRAQAAKIIYSVVKGM